MYKLLFVDDQPKELQGMTRMMNWAELGLEVAGAVTDPRQALRLVKEETVDIVVTDIIMQDMDGLTLLKQLKDSFPEVRIVCISGFDDFKFISMAVNNGASGYVLKPILVNEMRSVLERVVGEIRRERSRTAMPVSEESRVAMMCMNARKWIQSFDEKQRELPVRVIRGSGEAPERALGVLHLSGKGYVAVLPEESDVPEGAAVSPVMPLSMGYEAYLATFAEREKPDGEGAVVQIKENIEAHLGETMTGEQLYQGVFLSSKYASALFKESTGMTIHRYIIKRRLEEVARLLVEEPRLRIKDIAWRCGFADASHLINSFQKTYCMTPETYRRRHQRVEPKG